MNDVKFYKENGLEFTSITHRGMKVILCDLGASLYEVWFHNTLMTVQVQDSNDFKLEGIRFGKTIGRVSGRIPESKFSIDGKQYNVEPNEYGNCLHSGSDCFAQKKFEVYDCTNGPEGTSISYSYDSPDGEGGFPGKVEFLVTYFIQSDEDSITITFSSWNETKTPLSFTNHAYYCLGDPNISNISMLLPSEKYIEISNKDKLPIGTKPINKVFDFNKFKNITTDIDDPILNNGVKHGYDNYFFFKEENSNNPKLQIENQRFHMDVYTDFEGTMIYTNNTPKLKIKCKTTNQQCRKGIAIEPQESQLKDHLVNAGTQLSHWMTIVFREKK